MRAYVLLACKAGWMAAWPRADVQKGTHGGARTTIIFQEILLPASDTLFVTADFPSNLLNSLPRSVSLLCFVSSARETLLPRGMSDPPMPCGSRKA